LLKSEVAHLFGDDDLVVVFQRDISGNEIRDPDIDDVPSVEKAHAVGGDNQIS
jgi:hypothetical protein